MTTISAAAVDQLRKRTGMQMMKCKAALIEANGDMEKAVEILRKQNKDAVDKVVHRETAEGRIAVFIDPAQQVGAILEMRCETTPAAKNELFAQLANDLARHIALKAPADVDDLLKQPFVDNPAQTVAERISEVVGLVRENMKPQRFVRLTGLLGSYVHHDQTTGVLLQVEGASADPTLLRDVCMHIVAKNPVAARPEDVPPAVVAKEKDIALAQAAATGKPANIVEKIAEGKLKTWFAENVLVEQPFVKDETKTVGALLRAAGLKVVRFVRMKVGELS
ncbi:MAG: translation elongation factor Ts [Gemmataceae bacterium]|nr:translation elongation factor Ts [Gemmataceae bacterium]MDW8263820.1 translation elongation factor Ts [Gemmataceae bacterium]